MKNRVLKIAAAAVLVPAVLYFMPLVVTDAGSPDGRIWHVPAFSSVREVTDDQVNITAFRSAYALGKDAENAMHSYEESKCYGMTYYFDEVNDVSFTGYEVAGGLPAQVTYRYVPGNACAGWTLDDEVAWEDGDPQAVDPHMSPQEAMEKNWYVVQDGKILNIPQYYDFARMVKQGVFCVKRTVIYEQDHMKIIDVQLLESGRFLVTVTEDGEKNAREYGRFSEAEINGQKYASVYYGSLEDEPIPLYPVE